MTIAEITSRIAEVSAELITLGELAEPSEEELARFNELTTEYDDLEAKRQAAAARASRMEELRRAMAEGRFVAVPGAPSLDRDPLSDPRDVTDPRTNPWDLSGVRGLALNGAELRARALDAISQMSGTTDRRREAATRIIERWDDDEGTLSRLALAGSDPDYLRAFGKLFRAFGRQVHLSDREQAAIERAMSLTDASGGYLVPFQLDPTIIFTSDGSVNPFRQIARKVVATGDVWNGVSTTHATWSWDAEAAEVSDDATTFAQPTVAIHKGSGFIPISLEALQDEANVTEAISEILARGRDDLEATAFATGSGTAQPFGIVTALTGTSSEIASATADTFAVADVYNLEESLPAKYRVRASWTAHRAILNDIRQMGSSSLHTFWENLGGGLPPRLMGYPVYEASAMDGTVTAAATNFILILGDFNNYVVADRIGMTVEFIPHLFGTTNGRPLGRRGFYAYYRVGADSVNDGGFRMLNA